MNKKKQNLTQLRDKRLVERYYYYTEIKRMRFDDVLEVLSLREFFISEGRIMLILRKQSQYLEELIDNETPPWQLEMFAYS